MVVCVMVGASMGRVSLPLEHIAGRSALFLSEPPILSGCGGTCDGEHAAVDAVSIVEEGGSREHRTLTSARARPIESAIHDGELPKTPPPMNVRKTVSFH